jgi:hypothetical protein
MSKQTKQTKTAKEHHTVMETVGEKAAAIKDSIVESKNKVVATVEEKFDMVKKAIHDITAPSPKKKSLKKAVKKAVKKVAKKAAQKVIKPAKKAVKKIAKKTAKK